VWVLLAAAADRLLAPTGYLDQFDMRVSHETIHMSLFDPRQRALNRNLTGRLRTGRTMRHPRVVRRPSGRGQIRDMVPISRRPAETETRLVPGHWEGDLVMGKRPSAVATLVDGPVASSGWSRCPTALLLP
jgi:IS30 family transposase